MLLSVFKLSTNSVKEMYKDQFGLNGNVETEFKAAGPDFCAMLSPYKLSDLV